MNEKGTYLKGIKRVVEFYKCSTASIQSLVNNGTIPSYRTSRNRYFWSNEIDKALRDETYNNESDQLKSLYNHSIANTLICSGISIKDSLSSSVCLLFKNL